MRRSVLLLERPEWAPARKIIDDMIPAGYTYAEIVEQIEKSGKAPSRLNVSTLQRYHRLRYQRVSLAIQRAKEQTEAALQVLRESGDVTAGEIIRARLMEAFVANQHKLAEADPVKVGWLQVQYESLAQQRAELDHKNRELELKVQQMQEKAEKAKRAIDAQLEEIKTLDEATKRNIREELYGITAT